MKISTFPTTFATRPPGAGRVAGGVSPDARERDEIDRSLRTRCARQEKELQQKGRVEDEDDDDRRCLGSSAERGGSPARHVIRDRGRCRPFLHPPGRYRAILSAQYRRFRRADSPSRRPPAARSARAGSGSGRSRARRPSAAAAACAAAPAPTATTTLVDRTTAGDRLSSTQHLLQGLVRGGRDPAEDVAAAGGGVRLEHAGDRLEVALDGVERALRDLERDERLHAEAGRARRRCRGRSR